MATFNGQAARVYTTGSRGELREAFEQVNLGLSHIQEAAPQQEQRIEGRLLEIKRMIQEVSAEQEQRLEEEPHATDAIGGSVEETGRVATTAFEDTLRRVEARLEVLEGRSPPSEGQERDQVCGVEKRLSCLESRMERLETSTNRALQSVLPRVDALLNQQETHLLLPISTSASTSTCVDASAPSPTSSTSASSPSSVPRSSSTDSAAPQLLTPERRKKLGEDLNQAAEFGRETDVRRLLESGADPDVPNSKGWTSLMLAVRDLHLNVVSLLIWGGVDVNVKNVQQNTALHLASFNDKSGRCASVLIRAGALVGLANSNGQTPLHVAAMADNEAAARGLLAAGASKSVRDNGGRKPSECAKNHNLRRLLRP